MVEGVIETFAIIINLLALPYIFYRVYKRTNKSIEEKCKEIERIIEEQNVRRNRALLQHEMMVEMMKAMNPSPYQEPKYEPPFLTNIG